MTASSPRSLTVATARVTLKAHARITLRLKLSRSALAVLKRINRLSVTVHITVSAAGHRSRTLLRTVTHRFVTPGRK